MAIVNIKEIPASLFDQLLALNDLVQTLKDTKNLSDIVGKIKSERDATKKQYDDLAALKAQEDVSTKQLQDATDENLQSIADLNTAKQDAAQTKEACDISINKASTSMKLLAQAQADFDAKTALENSDLAKREAAVSDREKAASDAQSQADDLKADYQDRLDNIKKLAG